MGIVKRIPKGIVYRLAKHYMAGSSVDEGILNIIREYDEHGRYAAAVILGEASLDAEDAQRVFDAYLRLIDEFVNGHSKIALISVKPTAICPVTSDHNAIQQGFSLKDTLEALLNYATENGKQVTLDMEDHNWTDVTLNTASNLWDDGHSNLGIVLQSRLYRTPTDIERLLKGRYRFSREKLRVRIVTGIYPEPEDIAVAKKKEMKRRMYEQVKTLFGDEVKVEIATHDHELLRKILGYIDRKKIPSHRLEFQFLKGVQMGYDIENELMDRGHTVRYYMPIEIQKGDGIPYLRRRLEESPHIFYAAVHNEVRRFRKWLSNKF